LSDHDFVPADAVAPADLHAAFVAAFADYVAGPAQVGFEDWPALVARQGIALAPSRVVLADGQVRAFALVAPRPQGRRWRLACMGAVPEARGSGAAPALLDDFVVRAAAAGQVAVELECFARNERALRLYKSRRFIARHELTGWALAEDVPTPAPVGAAPREVDRATAFAWLDAAERHVGELPLQVTAPVLAASVRPLRFLQRGSALLAWSDPGDGPLQVASLVDTANTQADAQALVAAMRATRPGAAVSVPAIQRDDLCGNALRRLGFVRQELHQLMMLRAFGA